MPTQLLTIHESDIVKLLLEFLNSRDLCISLLSLERETGIVNGIYSEDMLFLRQLILDGQWDDALELVEPLAEAPGVDIRAVRWAILRHKYLELVCLCSVDGGGGSGGLVAEEVLACLQQLEAVSPSKEAHSELCLMLTSAATATVDPLFGVVSGGWNPSSGRVACFRQLLPLLEPTLRIDGFAGSGAGSVASGDRLVQLLAKGLLYETCVELCQARATGSDIVSNCPALLAATMEDSACQKTIAGASLVSWLESVPAGAFACPFEQRDLRLDLRCLERPSLEASWADQLLVAPPRPRVFPHSHVPHGLSRSVCALRASLGAPVRHQAAAFGSATAARELRAASLPPWQSIAGIRLSGLSERPKSAGAMSRTSWNAAAPTAASSALRRSMDRMLANGAADADAIALAQQRRPASASGPRRRAAAPSVIAEESEDHEDENRNAGDEEEMQGDNLVESEEEGSQENIDAQHGERENSAMLEQPLSDSAEEAQPPVSGDAEASRPSTGKSQLLRQSGADLFHEYQRRRQALMADLERRERERQLMQADLAELAERVREHQRQQEEDEMEASTATQPPVRAPRQSVGTPKPSSVRSSVASGRSATGSGSGAQSRQQTPKLQSGIGQRPASAAESNRSTVRASARQSTASTARGPANVSATSATFTPPPSVSATPSSTAATPAASAVVSKQDIQPVPRQIDRFVPIATVRDSMAVRAVAFDPSGRFLAVGSNSKTLRVCRFTVNRLAPSQDSRSAPEPQLVFMRPRVHKGSIYCLAWSPDSRLLATGSNDKTVRLLGIDSSSGQLDQGTDIELGHHDGTVRDLRFVGTVDAALLLTAGAGDCRIYLIDCVAPGGPTVQRAMPGHSEPVMALHSCNTQPPLVASASADKTVRLWDLRTPAPVQIIAAPTQSAYASVAIEPAGRLLASGHDDATVALYDIRGARHLTYGRMHADECRSVRFSADCSYLLTAGYDARVRLADLHGDLMQPLPHVTVAEHADKVIQCRWHPDGTSFVSSSADKTAIVWALQAGLLQNED